MIGKSIDSNDSWWITTAEGILVIPAAGWATYETLVQNIKTFIAGSCHLKRLITISEMLYTVHPD